MHHYTTINKEHYDDASPECAEEQVGVCFGCRWSLLERRT